MIAPQHFYARIQMHMVSTEACRSSKAVTESSSPRGDSAIFNLVLGCLWVPCGHWSRRPHFIYKIGTEFFDANQERNIALRMEDLGGCICSGDTQHAYPRSASHGLRRSSPVILQRIGTTSTSLNEMPIAGSTTAYQRL